MSVQVAPARGHDLHTPSTDPILGPAPAPTPTSTSTSTTDQQPSTESSSPSRSSKTRNRHFHLRIALRTARANSLPGYDGDARVEWGVGIDATSVEQARRRTRRALDVLKKFWNDVEYGVDGLRWEDFKAVVIHPDEEGNSTDQKGKRAAIDLSELANVTGKASGRNEVQGEADIDVLLRRLTSSPSALSGFLADVRDWDAYRLMMRRHNRNKVRGARSDTSSSPNSSTISISAPEPNPATDRADRTTTKRDSKIEESAGSTEANGNVDSNVGAAAVAGAAAAMAAAAAWSSSTSQAGSGAATAAAVAAAAAAAAWSSKAPTTSSTETVTRTSDNTTSAKQSPVVTTTAQSSAKSSTSCQTEISPNAKSESDPATMRAEAVQLLATGAFRVVLNEKEAEWAKERTTLHSALAATEEKVARVMRAISDALKVVTPEDSLSDLGDAIHGSSRAPKRNGSGRRAPRPILKKRVSFDTETLAKERKKEKANREAGRSVEFSDDEEEDDGRKGKRASRKDGEGWDSWSSASSSGGEESDDSADTASTISTITPDNLLDRVAADPKLANQVAVWLTSQRRKKRRNSVRRTGSGSGNGSRAANGTSSKSIYPSTPAPAGGAWDVYRMNNASRPCLIGDEGVDEIKPTSADKGKAPDRPSNSDNRTPKTDSTSTRAAGDDEQPTSSPKPSSSHTPPRPDSPGFGRAAISLHPSSTPLVQISPATPPKDQTIRRRPSSFPPSTDSSASSKTADSPPRNSWNEGEVRNVDTSVDGGDVNGRSSDVMGSQDEGGGRTSSSSGRGKLEKFLGIGKVGKR
ncbi:hypothetical protein HK097_008319 [Rhizophlyctis rosea]|uniref:Uncharacterized protein n=1 Tax=Rhizophlyctis rosea TaxID=64517 RepID=A0AAD5SAI4_9FUNG|nr:hypothetical protein HK097_008319 [Rhizophlyctis rosea]